MVDDVFTADLLKLGYAAGEHGWTALLVPERGLPSNVLARITCSRKGSEGRYQTMLVSFYANGTVIGQSSDNAAANEHETHTSIDQVVRRMGRAKQ